MLTYDHRVQFRFSTEVDTKAFRFHTLRDASGAQALGGQTCGLLLAQTRENPLSTSDTAPTVRLDLPGHRPHRLSDRVPFVMIVLFFLTAFLSLAA